LQYSKILLAEVERKTVPQTFVVQRQKMSDHRDNQSYEEWLT